MSEVLRGDRLLHLLQAARERGVAAEEGHVERLLAVVRQRLHQLAEEARVMPGIRGEGPLQEVLDHLAHLEHLDRRLDLLEHP